MSPLRSLLAVGLVLALAVPAAAFTMAAFQGKVVSIADGNTLTVLRDHAQVRVRLHGIDAPERGQPFGTRAKQFASDLAFGKVVTVEPTDRDRYGQIVAEVVLPDGRRLSPELLRAGYAWWYRRYSTDPTLGEIEAEARAARRGLWADAHPIPPWQWRQRKVTRVPRPFSPEEAGMQLVITEEETGGNSPKEDTFLGPKWVRAQRDTAAATRAPRRSGEPVNPPEQFPHTRRGWLVTTPSN